MTDELTRGAVELRSLPTPRRSGRGPLARPAAPAATAERAATGRDQAAAAATWSAEVRTDETLWAEDSPVRAEWDTLWARCPGSTVFQHSTWLRSWWAAYGRPGRLRVVLVRRSGVLVGAAALHLVRRGPVTVLTLVGAGISDFGDILAAAEDTCPDQPGASVPGDSAGVATTEIISRLRSALAGLGHPVDLRELPAESDARRLAEDWPHPVRTWNDSVCLSLPAHSFDETVRALPRRTASRVRGKCRRIDELGVSALVTPAGESAATIADLLRLHLEQWKDRGISAEHVSDRFTRHLSAAVPALIEAGYADLIQYRYEGELLGCELMLHSHGAVGSYLSGLSPRLRQKIDLATLLLRNGLGLAVQREATEYSMLRGLEPYKLRWSPRIVHNERVLLGAKGVGTALYAQSVTARKRLVKVAKKVLRRDDHAAREMRARLGDPEWADTE